MVKTRLYENEDEISRLVDTTLYDAIFLENRPVDLVGTKDYIAILTKRKESSEREKAGEWILKIFMKGTNGKWQLTPGQWYLKTLLGQDSNNLGGFLDEDTISVDGTENWKVMGMIEIIQEAIDKTEYEFDEEGYEPPELLANQPMENKNKDYSKMKKWELEQLVNQALDNKDYKMLEKIYKYLPEAVIGKVSFIHKHTLNEKLVHQSANPTHSIDLHGPEGNAFSILAYAKQLSKQLKEIDPETYNWEKIQSEMMSGEYKNLVLTFEKYFGDYVTIYGADVLEESLNESFASWYSENKDSEILWDEYAEYCLDVPKKERSSFKEWAKERYEWLKEYAGNVDEGIKHMKPRPKAEILKNMENDPELEKDEEIDESLNEKAEKGKILMGHNSPNPNDPEVNGMAYRIESEEDIKDKVEESEEDLIMPRLFEKYFTDEEEEPIEDKQEEQDKKDEEEKELKKYKTTDESKEDPFLMPRLMEDIDEGCGCGPKKRPTTKFTPAPKKPSIFRPRSK